MLSYVPTMTREEFLALTRLPGRLIALELSWLFHCEPEHVPIIVAGGLIKPLGHPAANGVKYFHTAEVLEIAADKKKMAQVSDLLSNTWRERNRQARAKAQGGVTKGKQIGADQTKGGQS